MRNNTTPYTDEQILYFQENFSDHSSENSFEAYERIKAMFDAQQRKSNPEYYRDLDKVVQGFIEEGEQQVTVNSRQLANTQNARYERSMRLPSCSTDDSTMVGPEDNMRNVNFMRTVDENIIVYRQKPTATQRERHGFFSNLTQCLTRMICPFSVSSRPVIPVQNPLENNYRV